MTRSSSSLAPALFLCLGLRLVLPAGVSAQASMITGLGGTRGWGENCIGMNDDGSSNAISVLPAFPAGLRFFTTTHNSLNLNTNGNITFSGPLPTYTPDAFPVASRPMIAPFWADVDTRTSGFLGLCSGPGDGVAVMGPACDNPAQNGIWWDVEPGRMIFTWDRVGYYRCRTDRRMSFQLVLTAAPGCAGAGDFDVEFRFNRCEWETGDASGGSGGFGGTPAQSGFDAGDNVNFVEIAMSRTAGIANRLCTMSNVGMPGIWQFQIRGGSVICPDAGMACTVSGAMGACAMGRTNCVGGGTMCVQQVFPEAERCDNLDNDCNGVTDDGDPAMLCRAGFVCRSGACVENCFESACPVGQVCVDPGVCVEAGCETVTCAEGERCVAGSCLPACDGVVCPHGETCTAGRCVNPCLGLTCDDCTTCDDGTCVARCDMGGRCAAGETCGAGGACVETACVGVSCSPGSYCAGGACVDACTGVVCPFGQECRVGACVAIELPDAGPGFDGGPRPDGGMTMDPDAGMLPGFDAGVLDAGRAMRPPPRSTGCACRVPAGGRSGVPWAFGGLALVAVLAHARRRTR